MTSKWRGTDVSATSLRSYAPSKEEVTSSEGKQYGYVHLTSWDEHPKSKKENMTVYFCKFPCYNVTTNSNLDFLGVLA